jgi:hypothetical protein
VSEPRITINGQELSEGQATTIRVAIESFAADLRSDGLGDDDHGRKMVAGYMARLNEIRDLIFSAALKSDKRTE